MTPVLSGGLVYEYSEEPSDYGLVSINSNGSAQLLPDFDTLQSQFNTLNVTALQGLKAQNTSVVPPTCAASLISSSFDSNFTIPAVPPGAQDLIDNGIANKNNGKLVPVTATKVTQQVEDASGTVMTGLAITPLADDESNNPGHSSTSSATASAASPTKTKKSAAVSVRGNSNAMVTMVLLVLGYVSLF